VYAAANNGTNTGWVTEGTWTPGSGSLTVVSVTPNAGTGTTQIFAAAVSDPNGLTDLKTMHLLFNTTSASQASSCSVYYLPGTNQLYLYGDNGTTLLGPLTPGTGMVANSQCTLGAAGTSVSTSGNTLTLNVALTFTPAFTGLKNIYVYAAGNNGTNTGWVSEGTWTP
jgi:hypothetical protein